MTFEEWFEIYQPIKNNDEVNFEGYAFECNSDLEKVNNYDFNYIWTLVDSDFEEQYILPNRHLVNRSCYFITEIPWENENIEVDLNDKLTQEESIYHCFTFFKENNITISKQIISKWYEHYKDLNDELISINKAKYLAIELFETMFETDLSEDLNNLIHNYYSQIL